jgi:hypothetical protein
MVEESRVIMQISGIIIIHQEDFLLMVEMF